MPALKFNPDGSIHVHTYVRKGEGRKVKYYRCEHPKCTHYDHKDNIRGKETLCAICKKNKFILNSEHLKMARPRCLDCSQTSEAKNIRENKKILEETLNLL